MRTLTDTLGAAQRLSAQVPAVRVLVRDKQARFSAVGTYATMPAQSAMCVANDGALVVASLYINGEIKVRRVTDPEDWDSWGTWPGGFKAVVNSALPVPKGDVALSNNTGVLRLFYVGGSDGKIYARESTDDGVSWGAAYEVVAPWGRSTDYEYKLASAGHDDLWYTVCRPGYRYIYMMQKVGGSWGAPKHVQYLMETGGEYTNCYGLSAQWDAAAGEYAVVASLDRASNGDGRIVSAHWDYESGTLSDYQGIVPPGIPMAGFTPLWPSLLRMSDDLDNQWMLFYWDTYNGARCSWMSPVCLLSRDFEHWSYRIPLPLDIAYYRRVSLAESDKVVYVYQVHECYKADLWYSGKEGAEMTVVHGDVLRYRVMEYPERGWMDIELDNRDGSFDDAAALKPLAQVVIEHGLKTTAGTERVESRPMFYWRGSRVRESGVNLYRIHAVDGWELFRMWRPDWTIVWQDKTLRWCIEELAARVGYFRVAFDQWTGLWDQVVDYFTVAPTMDWRGRWWVKIEGTGYTVSPKTVVITDDMSGLVILRRLLDLVGGAARFGNGDDTDVLYCFLPWAQGDNPGANYTYNDGEIIAGQYADSFPLPTRFRVVGTGVVLEYGVPNAALACGMDVLRVYQISQLNSLDECSSALMGMKDDAAAMWHGGWLKARPNVGLELYDVIQITDSKAGGGLEGAKRRVNGIETEYEPLQKPVGWMQTVYVEGV